MSRWNDGRSNRWFRHLETNPSCPWYQAKTARDILALQYQGQQEGRRHIALKQFIARWLGNEPRATKITTEKTVFALNAPSRWRRPDVRCHLEGAGPLVFEVQLSYTFLRVVVERDEFYAADQTHVIWVFSHFDLERSTTQDELHFNRGNLFVLDEEAREETTRRNRLTLKCYFRDVRTSGSDDAFIDECWTYRFVSLDDLQFPNNGELPFRPYYVDSELRWKGALEVARAASMDRLRVRVLEAATAYYERGEESARKVLQARMQELAGRGFRLATEGDFWFGHELLNRLLCIARDRSIGYDYPTTFEVINAARSARGIGGFAVMLLAAVKAYQPALSDRHGEMVQQWRDEVLESIKTLSDASPYTRDTRFDEVVSFLLPELKGPLASRFGRPGPKREAAAVRSVRRVERLSNTRDEDVWLRGRDLEEWKRKHPDAWAAWSEHRKRGAGK